MLEKNQSMQKQIFCLFESHLLYSWLGTGNFGLNFRLAFGQCYYDFEEAASRSIFWMWIHRKKRLYKRSVAKALTKWNFPHILVSRLLHKDTYNYQNIDFLIISNCWDYLKVQLKIFTNGAYHKTNITICWSSNI